jgi:hypothetical protein
MAAGLSSAGTNLMLVNCMAEEGKCAARQLSREVIYKFPLPAGQLIYRNQKAYLTENLYTVVDRYVSPGRRVVLGKAG